MKAHGAPVLPGQDYGLPGRILLFLLLDPHRYADGSIHDHFRSLPPVSWQERPGYWAVLGYPEALRVLCEPALFSSAYGTGIVGETEPAHFVSLNLSDPPAHTWLRRQVVNWLQTVRPAYVPEEEPLRGLPRQTLQAILGVDAAEAHALQQLSVRIAYAESRPLWRAAEDELMTRLRLLRCPLDLQPTDGLYLLRLLVLSGLESTTTALASLCQHRPGPDMLEEMLRLHPPIQRFGRRVMKPVRLGNADLQAGQRVIVFFAAANRDPRVFSNPHRPAPPHLTFGAGPHRCPGAALARRQMRLLLAAPPAPPTKFHASSFTMGPP